MSKRHFAHVKDETFIEKGEQDRKEFKQAPIANAIYLSRMNRIRQIFGESAAVAYRKGFVGF